jgi:hypothetical protein
VPPEREHGKCQFEEECAYYYPDPFPVIAQICADQRQYHQRYESEYRQYQQIGQESFDDRRSPAVPIYPFVQLVEDVAHPPQRMQGIWNISYYKVDDEREYHDKCGSHPQVRITSHSLLLLF